jgi:hypothetical protein
VSLWIVVHVPTWLIGVLVVAGLPLAAVGVQALLRRLAPGMRRGGHNDVAGFLLAVIGVIYGVVVAFVIIALWEDFTAARATVQVEASKLDDVVRDAEAFGEPTGGRVRSLAAAYAGAVASAEWDAMGGGRREARAAEADRALDGLFAAVRQAPAGTPAQAAFLDQALTRLNDLAEARDERLHHAGESIPGVLWVAILAGSAITLGFCLLFGLEDARLHYLMVAGVAGIIAVNLFLVLVLDHPFAGQVAVTPEAMAALAADLAAGGPGLRPAGDGRRQRAVSVLWISPRTNWPTCSGVSSTSSVSPWSWSAPMPISPANSSLARVILTVPSYSETARRTLRPVRDSTL